MNIAFISAAHIHTRSFMERIAKDTTGVKAYAVWDDVPDRGQRYAAEFGATFVADLGQLARDRQVDAFMICAENTKHVPLLKKILPRGKPVFCDKPLVTTGKELRSLAKVLAAHGSRLVCGYFHAHSGELRAVKKLLAEGHFGSITRVRFRNAHTAAYGRWFDPPDLHWFQQPELSGGGAFMDMGTHSVHVLRTLFGPVTEVWAEIGNQSGRYPTVDDFGIAHLKFASGIRGIAEAAWTHTGAPCGLEVVGSAGALWFDGVRYVVSRDGKAPVPLTPLPARPDRVDRLCALGRGELTAEEVAFDLEVCRDAVTVMEAAYASSRKGTWISIPPSRAVPV